MTPEYTAAQQRADEWNRDLRRLLEVLWGAACEADPTIRSHPVGRHARSTA